MAQSKTVTGIVSGTSMYFETDPNDASEYIMWIQIPCSYGTPQGYRMTLAEFVSQGMMTNGDAVSLRTRLNAVRSAVIANLNLN